MLFKTSSAKVVASIATTNSTDTTKLSSFEFKPSADDGYLYVAARAVSARVNSNYDAFSEETLRESYQTFISKPVYVNHDNTNPDRARGVIIDAKLHDEDPDDIWVEILMEMDEKTFPVLCSYIRSGELDTMSMGCYLDYSICSVCGNQASVASDYCEHINNKGVEYDGIIAYEDCIGVTFYEESWVYVPADDTAMTQAILQEDDNNNYNLDFDTTQFSQKQSQLTVPTIKERNSELCPICESTQFDGKNCSVCGHTEEIKAEASIYNAWWM